MDFMKQNSSNGAAENGGSGEDSVGRQDSSPQQGGAVAGNLPDDRDSPDGGDSGEKHQGCDVVEKCKGGNDDSEGAVCAMEVAERAGIQRTVQVRSDTAKDVTGQEPIRRPGQGTRRGKGGTTGARTARVHTSQSDRGPPAKSGPGHGGLVPAADQHRCYLRGLTLTLTLALTLTLTLTLTLSRSA